MAPALSIVVVAYDMGRELPRTLATLTTQRGSPGHEVVVVDNGSPEPVDGASLPDGVRLIRVDPALPSPASAANAGIAAAEGDLVGLIIDGARMASPGLLATAHLASRLADRPVIATLGWHLGPSRHMDDAGHDQAAEDRLLADIDWQEDGYRLFEVSTLAGSSGRGWFGPVGESSALFMTAELWREVGGLDERFDLPGGGLVNHDLYRRACGLPDVRLITLLGEGTFHQVHGGVATSRRMSWDQMHAQYEEIRGEAYRPPTNEPLYLGSVPRSTLVHLGESVRLAVERAARRQSAEG